jgi:hypothetical protein
MKIYTHTYVEDFEVHTEIFMSKKEAIRSRKSYLLGVDGFVDLGLDMGIIDNESQIDEDILEIIFHAFASSRNAKHEKLQSKHM